jgi:ADP-heptose:LPS heptosyltransferase
MLSLDMPKLAVEREKRVWILRPDNLGDAVLFSGALRHFRAHYSQAEITLCVKEYVQNLLELCPHVDRIISWEDILRDMYYPFLNWLPPIRGRERLEYSLQRILIKLKYRTGILLLPVRSPTPTMHAFIKAMWADTRYGIAGDFCRQSKKNDQEADGIYTARLRIQPHQCKEHELLITQNYLRSLGMEVSLEDLWPEFWTDDRDRRWAKESVPRAEGGITLAICPGVTNKVKVYKGANYAQVIRLLSRWQFNIVLFGSASEKEICDQTATIFRICDNVVSVKNFAGQTSLRQLIEGLRRCDAVLSVDSASLHIGAALHKPTVGIMGGGHYGRFYPWGNPTKNRVAHLPMDCYWCSWRCRYSTIRCIQEIRPDRIADELKAALDVSDQKVDSPTKQARPIA